MDELTRTAHAARFGNRRALEQFVKVSYPDVWRLCAALVDASSADDLAQETFLRATRSLRRFNGQASARTWVLAIARRTCMDELRGRYRTRRRGRELIAAADAAAAGPDPAGDVSAYELVSHLEPDRRAAFVLTQLLRLSYADAAAVCDCPLGTIRSRVARARGDLIALLEEGHAQRRLPNG